MKILVTGKSGQIGYELERSLQGLGQIVAVGRAQMDISDLTQVRDVIRTIKPALIINAAGYTDVEKAESEQALAMRINGEAPAVMAEEAKKVGAAMIHYSTDYVFDGTKPLPYIEEDPPCPMNAYGISKLEGERAIRAVGVPHLILRTSWVYGMRGKNFLLTVLRLAREGGQMRIVSDQHGAPTWSRTIAEVTSHIVVQSLASSNRRDWWHQRSGVYHLTAQGQTTWYAFAKAILDHPLVGSSPDIMPILSRDHPSDAKRPHNSVMCCDRLLKTFCSLPTWEEALRLCRD